MHNLMSNYCVQKIKLKMFVGKFILKVHPIAVIEGGHDDNDDKPQLLKTLLFISMYVWVIEGGHNDNVHKPQLLMTLLAYECVGY